MAAPNIAQYQADQDAARTDGSGKPIRTLEIPTAGPPKRTDDRSVLTDEMSNLHEHMLSKQRMAEMQADDDVSALVSFSLQNHAVSRTIFVSISVIHISLML